MHTWVAIRLVSTSTTLFVLIHVLEAIMQNILYGLNYAGDTITVYENANPN